MDIGEIESLTDLNFPHRNNGLPSYLPYQRETIIKILKVFLIDNKKFVALDGPVGCGKSAINYTVCKCIDGNSIYITPYKQLQDQIIREKWDFLRMLKGRNAYCCNHKTTVDKYFSCADEERQCEDLDRSKYCNWDINSLNESIEDTIEAYFDKKSDLIKRSAFSDVDDYNKFIKKNIKEVGDENNLVRGISCTEDSIECPYESSKSIVQLTKIKLLNPDIFFAMNSSAAGEFWGESSLLVFDESHMIESVINRIFSCNIPIELLYEVFHIDMRGILNLKSISEFSKYMSDKMHNKVGPLLCALRIMSRLGELLKVRNIDGSIGAKSSYNKFKEELSKIYYKGNSYSVNVFNICRLAFIGECDESYENINLVKVLREDFVELSNKYKCSDRIDISEFIAEPDDMEIFHPLKRFLMGLYDNVSGMLVVKTDDKDPFVFEIREIKAGECEFDRATLNSFTSLLKNGDNEIVHVVDIVPVAIGKLMSYYFYSKETRVLLSTGTWVDKEGTFNLLSMPKDDVECIKIPSTFPTTRRPVFLAPPSTFVNFSEKGDRGYYYKSDEGTQRFCSELEKVILDSRNYVSSTHKGCNPNIMIHCHTFDIANRIARNCRLVDEKFLIHTNNKWPIKNTYNGYTIDGKPNKEKLLEYFMTHPNTGLTLISPSMEEGVDFKNGIARIQIILKSPTPNIGSPYVNTRCNGNEAIGIKPDRNYFDRVLFTTVIQQYGRIMRGPDDWGYTIIMDEALVKKILGAFRDRKRFDIDYLLDGVVLHDGKLYWPF